MAAAPKKSVAKEAGQDNAGSPPEFTKEQELKALRARVTELEGKVSAGMQPP